MSECFEAMTGQREAYRDEQSRSKRAAIMKFILNKRSETCFFLNNQNPSETRDGRRADFMQIVWTGNTLNTSNVRKAMDEAFGRCSLGECSVSMKYLATVCSRGCLPPSDPSSSRRKCMQYHQCIDPPYPVS